MKKCRVCGIEKDVNDFHRQSAAKDGLKNKCKICCKAYAANYHIENREDVAAKSAIYRRDHKDEKKEIAARYYINNKEHLKSNIRDYQKTVKGKEVKSQSNKRNHSKHPNARASRIYYGSHKHKLTIPDRCQICNEINKLEAHHMDYDKPMEVIHLCNLCHVEEHKENIPLNRVSGIFTVEKLEAVESE